jgi:DMSO/TMAO reductase YedYZ heme-binding membrane subunit
MNYIITGTTTTARVNKSWQEIKLFVWLVNLLGDGHILFFSPLCLQSRVIKLEKNGWRAALRKIFVDVLMSLRIIARVGRNVIRGSRLYCRK